MRYLLLVLALPGTALAQPNRSPQAPTPPPVLAFQRRGCEGTCPDYAATVYLDGRVEYDGRFYVPVRGKHTLHLPATQVAKLLAEAQRIHFERFREQYLPAHPTFDPPGASVLVRLPGQAAHRVVVEAGQPLPAPLESFFTQVRQCLDPLAGLR